MNKVKMFLKTFLGIPASIISFYFIFRLIYDNRDTVYPMFSNIRIETLLSGIFFLMLYFVVRGIGWRMILKINGYKLGYHDAVYYFSLSEIKRYIPGNIISFIARISKFSEFQIPAKKIVSFLFIESFLIVLSSSVWGLLSLNLLRQISSGFSNTLVLSVYFLLLFLLITFSVIYAKHRKINPFYYINVLFVYILGWALFGIGNFLIVSSFFYLDPHFFLEIVSLFVLSWLVGYLSFVTPMGLGVREATLAYLLKNFLPLSMAFSLALASRIILIFSEIFFLGVLYLLKIIKEKSKAFIGIFHDKHLLTLSFLIFLYVVYFTYVSFAKHQNFFTGRFDLGNMDQTVWNTVNGRVFLLTNPDGTNIISRLAIHADFLLILISPLYILWNDPKVLLLIQTIILGLGALFIYLLGLKVIGNKLVSIALSISFLLNPFLQKQNLFDFHAVSLSTTFLLAAFYFLHLKKYLIFLLLSLITVLTKENIFITVGLFGIYIFLSENRIINRFKKFILLKKISKVNFLTLLKKVLAGKKYYFWLFMSCVSFIMFYLLVAKFIPEARKYNHFALSYFSDFGDSPIKIMSGIILNPVKTLILLFSLENLDYIKKVFLPVGLLSFFSPLFFIFAVPDMLINMLSNNKNLISLEFHYTATIIPFVYISSIFGIKKILSLKLKFINKTIIFYYVMSFSILSTWSYGALPGSANPALEVFTLPANNNREIRNFLSQISEKLSITATNNLGAHLSHREYIYTIPNGIDKADMVIFLLNDQFAQPSLNAQKDMVRDLNSNINYVEVFKSQDFVAFAKRNIANIYFNTVYLPRTPMP